MRVFIIIANPLIEPTGTASLGSLRSRVAREFKDNFLELGPTVFAVAREAGTTKEISDALKISTDEVGHVAMVVAIDAYFGRARKDLWDWLLARMAGGIGG